MVGLHRVEQAFRQGMEIQVPLEEVAPRPFRDQPAAWREVMQSREISALQPSGAKMLWGRMLEMEGMGTDLASKLGAENGTRGHRDHRGCAILG